MSATTVHFVDRSTTVLFPASTAVMTSAGFLALLQAYNDSLPFFNSNEDAISGTDPDGNPTTALAVGDEYKAGPGNTSVPYGTKLTVTT